MSILHIKQIRSKILAMFESELDLTDLSPKDKERDKKISTRCLAAFAVYSNVECTLKEAAESVVDGGDDNGIDAIFYSPLNKLMIIVQSKFSQDGKGEPSASDVSTFTTGVRDLFDLNFERFNPKINKKSKVIETAVNAYDTKYKVVLIDTYTAQDLAEHATRHIDDLLTDMNNTGDDSSDQIVTFTRMNQSKVYNTLGKAVGDEQIDIEVTLSNWGQVIEPYKAYYGMVSGSELASWWAEHNTLLFTTNLRQALGSTDVNDEIQKTLKDDQAYFWYFNNGITITCDTIDKAMAGGNSREFGTFKMKNARIVNGAQTVSTIGKYANRPTTVIPLDDVKVSARIIQLSDAPEDFGKDVTRTNNRQNRIENRDFVSQDQEQIRMKQELAMDGIDYNIMRSESYSSSDKSFDLSEATAALACTSGQYQLAVQAKSGIGRFWENIDRGIYKQIFNASVSGYYVYNCVRLVRAIEEVINNEIAHLPRRTGRTYGLLVHGNRLIEMLTISKLGIKPSLDSNEFILDTKLIENKTKEVISEMGSYIAREYSDNFLATLFKNSGKCSSITNHVISTIS